MLKPENIDHRRIVCFCIVFHLQRQVDLLLSKVLC